MYDGIGLQVGPSTVVGPTLHQPTVGTFSLISSFTSKVVEARDVEQFKAELDEAWKDITHLLFSLRYSSLLFLLPCIFISIALLPT